ncbi:glycine zipper family protein [Burkholderia catarinensis]|uniref:glycine zipper family protein n=1 Tax=Burkholderia catarinensis TaxID=1108140 RepID=UPI001C592A54|nr:glycine zipper domain-containing protein [Burkholderia catarinensis]KAG8152920.1 glycine zipper family protein [Burkholderia catarinensis]
MASARQRAKGTRQGAHASVVRTWRFTRVVAGVVALTIISAVSAQQQPIYYPAKGQSAQTQQTDTAECQVWAKQTTGVDPVALAQRSAYAPAPPPQGGTLRGAAGGAAAGAAIGAIAGDAGKGAAIGAITGTAGGMMRRHRREEAAAYQQQATQGSTATQLSTFTRAVTACMNGRGYTSQ